MAKGFFITGTDTNIGKTFTSCALLHLLSQQGFKVAGMKPIASGSTVVQEGTRHSVTLNGHRLQNADALALMRHSNLPLHYAQVNPYCFEPAIAPHLAAAQADVEIDINTIQQAYDEISKQADWVIVEGVGGWRVPINSKQTVADMALQLKLPVILVVGMRLGCINHALLSMESLKSTGVEIKGWIANKMDDMDFYQETLKTLQNKMKMTYLGSMPYFENAQLDLDQCTQINLKV